MVTSDFRPEVEIRPFRACALKFCFKTCVAMKFVDDNDDDDR